MNIRILIRANQRHTPHVREFMTMCVCYTYIHTHTYISTVEEEGRRERESQKTFL